MAWATVPVDRAFREPRDWESGDELSCTGEARVGVVGMTGSLGCPGIRGVCVSEAWGIL